MGEALGIYEDGIFRKGDVRISDLSGRKMLPIGNDSFVTVVQNSVFVDKSMLIADVIDGGFAAMLFCRPRRFGKSLNLSMLQRFFEIPSSEDPSAMDTAPLFSGLAIWDAEGGRYREHHQAYPVIRISFNDAKQQDWESMRGALAGCIAAEYRRHGYLLRSERLLDEERELFRSILRSADEGALTSSVAKSLLTLSYLLFKHHGRRVVILVDEYDAPVMAGRTYCFYDKVVGFIKSWLTGALKSNDALAFAVLTGVQRISKESIFSDLNNLKVNTALNVASDECYGFTDDEVAALADYLGVSEAIEVARSWYDGYRFGSVDVYNPWSVLNFFQGNCVPDVYWGNTSSNSVLGDMVRGADARALGEMYALMEPNGVVEKPLDLGVVFPDVGVRPEAVWSMLYLAGYLTTNDTAFPNDIDRLRPLSVPNREVAKLFRSEILQRFAEVAGGRERLRNLHTALVEGDAGLVCGELADILLGSASYFDLTSENSYHMLILGLLFGMPGYADPISNREAGHGRFDVRLEPGNGNCVPIVIELKYARSEGELPEIALQGLADAALAQIADRAYASAGTLAYGIAFSGKRVAVGCRFL